MTSLGNFYSTTATAKTAPSLSGAYSLVSTPKTAPSLQGFYPVPFDPEAGLTLTQTFPEDTLDNADFDPGLDAVFACDLVIPATPSGLIMELGGTARGAWVGFRSDNSFVIRGGDGGPNAPTASASGMAVLYLASGQPAGSGTLVWEYDISLAQIRAWWNGESLGTAAATNGSFEANAWSANSNGAYDVDSGTVVAAGELDTGLGASVAGLRYYQNQTVSA